MPSEIDLCITAIQHGFLLLSSEWVLTQLFRYFYFGLHLDVNDVNDVNDANDANDVNDASDPSGLENLRVYCIQVLWNVMCLRCLVEFQSTVRLCGLAYG